MYWDIVSLNETPTKSAFLASVLFVLPDILFCSWINVLIPSLLAALITGNVRRKLIGIETAGNINVLFTDKTGTLTNGKLDVVSFLDGSGNEITYMNDKIRELFNMSISVNNDSSYDKVNNKIIGGN